MRRFDWWDDAVEVARLLAEQTGRRHRVYWAGGPRPWRVTPALRLVAVSEVCS